MVDIALMLEGQEDLTWERFLGFARAAEDLGFEGLFRSDHLTSLDGRPERESLALWPSLTALALQTERIRFGPLVCSVTFRHPAMVAKMAVAVDQLSGGRLDLGLGAGWFPREHEMFGISYPAFADRLERLDQAAELVRALWSGDVTSTEGHYPLRDAQNHPGPAAANPALIMGGKGERTLQVVARHATEWNCSYETVDVFVSKSRELDEACHSLGRDPAGVRRSVMLPFAIGGNPRAVQDHIDGHRKTFSDLPADAEGWRRQGFIAGSPDQVVDQIAAFAEVGASRFMLQQNALDDLGSVELLASSVLPSVRNL